MMTRTSEEFREAILDLLQEMRWDTPTFLEEFQRNHVTREGALIYGLEHCVFAANFPRWLANITGNCPHLEVRKYLIEKGRRFPGAFIVQVRGDQATVHDRIRS